MELLSLKPSTKSVYFVYMNALVFLFVLIFVW